MVRKQPTKQTYGQRLKQLREDRGLSQGQFATSSGISVGTIRNHEQDRGGMVADQLFAYCKALGVRCDSFSDCVRDEADKRTVSNRGRHKKNPK